MRTKRVMWGMSVAFLVLCAAGPTPSALAQVPDDERIPVTDPAMLERMGFPPDAQNVFTWSQAKLGQTGAERPIEPSSFGTTAKGFAGYSGMPSFQGNSSAFIYGTLSQGIFCDAATAVGAGFADAHLQPPNGAILDAVGWWWSDNAAQSSDLMDLFVFQTCLPIQGLGTPVITQLGSANTPSAAVGNGYTNVVVNFGPVDTKRCTYTVRVSFRGNQPNACIGSNLTTYKVREEWRRQISPAPVNASFTDVPTNHQFFQQIEALFAAGITAGSSCAPAVPPSYCPNNTVTRGQMAAFLARALGLHWGGIP